MKGKPRLLFLAYYFPPINTIGCVRAYNMAKWLTRKGWEVTVVTPYELARVRQEDAMDLGLEGIRCIRTEHHWLSLSALREPPKAIARQIAGHMSRRIATSLGIEREAGWIGDAEKACAGLTPEDVDVILASGPPFASFGLAQRLAERLGRPYVLDYRDLWTGNPHAKQPARRRTIDRERNVLAVSAATTGISPSLGESLQNQFGMMKAVHIISNGFDPEELAQVPPHAFRHFAIVYTGAFYPPKRTVAPLMAALRQLDRVNTQKRDWAFHYYGHQSDYVRRAAQDCGVEHRVVMHGNVSRSEALAAVRGANVAVVISSVYEQGSLEDKGIVTGKIFDAIGFGTPLLVIAPSGSDLEGILAVTGLGKRFAGTETTRIAGFVRAAMNGGSPRSGSGAPFSWSEIGGKLDCVLRDVAQGR